MNARWTISWIGCEHVDLPSSNALSDTCRDRTAKRSVGAICSKQVADGLAKMETAAPDGYGRSSRSTD